MKKFFLALMLTAAVYGAPRTFEMSGGGAALPVEDHYLLGKSAYKKGKWNDAIYQLAAVTKHFLDFPRVAEAHYMSGRAHYALRQWDFAEREFSAYLEKSTGPKHFEEVLRFKFEIANRYRRGTRKHAFGMRGFPRWTPAKEDALRIYDEITTALPSSEMAAHSFYAKGHLLWELERYQEGVEAFQSLIYRFPNHAYAPESYLCISKLYVDWCEAQPQNPDVFPLSLVNLRKFRKEFPTDEKLLAAEGCSREMKELLAQSMTQMANFYERTKKPEAAAVYYRAAMREYPGTVAAKVSNEQLALLDVDVHE